MTGSGNDEIDGGTFPVAETESSMSRFSLLLLHGPGEPQAAIGEGSGVILTTGPMPGEDTADAGESELRLWCDVVSADLILELRTGRPVAGVICCGYWSTAAVALDNAGEANGSLACASVCKRRPALSGEGVEV